MYFYFFNTNFDYYYENYNNLIGVWDSFDSMLLFDLFKDKTIKFDIEENLYNHYKEFIELSPLKVVPSKVNNIDYLKTNNLFFISSDTIFYLFKNLFLNIKDPNILVSKIKKENEIVTLDKNGYKYFILEKWNELNKYDNIILGNDWGPIEKYIIDKFYKQNKLAICVQESIIDFSISSNRMKYCDIPIIQGSNTLKHLKRKFYAITGNPRYENIKHNLLPNNKKVMINSNFTYGVSLAHKNKWLDDIIGVLNMLKIDYLILQHPRDSKLERYSEYAIKTNASIIHENLESCSILITRFSSLIHEALVMGKYVIYYNFMEESYNYNFEFNNDFLFEAKNICELKVILEKIVNSIGYDKSTLNDYLRKHIGKDFVKPTNKIIEFLTLLDKNKTYLLKNKKVDFEIIKNNIIYNKIRFFSNV